MTQIQRITEGLKEAFYCDNAGLCIVYDDNKETICRKIGANSKVFHSVRYNGSESLVVYTIEDGYEYNLQDEESYVNFNIFLITEYYFEKDQVLDVLKEQFDTAIVSGEGNPSGIYAELFGDDEDNPFRGYAFKFTVELNLEKCDVRK